MEARDTLCPSGLEAREAAMQLGHLRDDLWVSPPQRHQKLRPKQLCGQLLPTFLHHRCLPVEGGSQPTAHKRTEQLRGLRRLREPAPPRPPHREAAPSAREPAGGSRGAAPDAGWTSSPSGQSPAAEAGPGRRGRQRSGSWANAQPWSGEVPGRGQQRGRHRAHAGESSDSQRLATGNRAEGGGKEQALQWSPRRAQEGRGVALLGLGPAQRRGWRRPDLPGHAGGWLWQSM